MHKPELIDHFQNPRNVGELEPPAVVVEVENPACGDVMRVSALVSDDRFERVAYRVRGCTASIAAGSAVTELIVGRSVAEAAMLGAGQIDAALGGLPAESRHAAALAIDAVRALLNRIPAK